MAAGVRAMVGVLLVVGAFGALPGTASAQESDEAVRIVARQAEDGRVEFGLQQRGADGAWGDRMLPSRRFFPPGVTVGRWLASSPLTSAATGAATADVRIVARRVEDGRVEFGLQQRGADGAWGDRMLPSRRFFPPGVTVGRWLASSPLTVAAAEPVQAAFSIDHGLRGGDTLIAAARGRTCTVRLDGGVTCWGQDGLRERMSVAGLENVEMISIADHRALGLHACALHRDRTVSCWGPGHEGSLGQGNETSHYLPVAVRGIADAVAVSAGAYFTCAAHSDGGVSCWGNNAYGELGRGSGGSRHAPVRVPGLLGVVAIAAGPHTSCAVHGDGGVSCWGAGFGNTPSRVDSLSSAVSVSVGSGSACAATVDRHVYCWPFARPVGSRLVRVGDIDDVVNISVGDGSACALHSDGGVSCWGSNSAGQLGNGTTTAAPRPSRVPGIADAVAVSISLGSPKVGAHACALHENGTASCWGGNSLGQLGDGTYEDALTPRPVMRFDEIPADQLPTSQTALLRTWVDLEVQQREAEFPWLRVAWDYIRDRTVAAPAGSFGATVSISCYSAAGSYGCRSERMTVSAMEFGGIVHELAHVYDLTTGLAPSKAWGAVQLYFASTYTDCRPPGAAGEILADTAKHLLVPSGWLTYYESNVCSGVPPEPSREAEEVVLAGLAGEVPAWYSQNITNGMELWEAWLRAPSLPALANLSAEFGGLCSTAWIRNPLDPALFPPAGSNPFRESGC